MSRFILIHGGLHGAWCWQSLEPELHRLGHETVAMDLPVDLPGRTLDAYADTVMAHMPAGAAILVGHSLGGFVAPRIVARRPECRIIMLCAGFPPTCEAERRLIDADDFPGMIKDDLGRIHAPPDLAIRMFYGGVPAAIAAQAAARLRPQWVGAFTDSNLVAPYRDRVAAVIACQDDPVAPVAEQQRLARQMFGLEVHVLPGGHSPFLACPRPLAGLLDAVARSGGA